MTKSILISGASGYLGGIARRYFACQGYQVKTIGRSLQDDFYFDFGSFDYSQYAALKKIEADIFIHAAAANEVICRENPASAYAVNVAGTKSALELAIEHKISSFVYISTFHVFNVSQGVIDESVTPIPTNDYGMSHYLAEQLVEMVGSHSNLTTLTIRPANLFGIPENIEMCKRWSLVPLEFCKEAVANRKIVLKTAGLQERNFVDTDDLMRCIERYLGNEQLIHCYGPDTLSILDFAKLVCEVSQRVLGEKVVLEAPLPDDVIKTKSENSNFQFTSLHEINANEGIAAYCEKMLRVLSKTNGEFFNA